MFCYQCEQTAQGKGCDKIGVCSKKPEVSDLQDLLVYTLRGLALVDLEARKAGIVDPAVGAHCAAMLFSTLTNVDFDPERFKAYIDETVALRENLKAKAKAAGAKFAGLNPAASFTPNPSLDGLVKQGEAHGLKNDPIENPDLLSLSHIVLFGIKGVAAYADHAKILGVENDKIYEFLSKALAAGLDTSLGLNDWLGLALGTGEANLWAMEALDKANTEAYGHPVPTEVPLGHKKGKAILISGHDLKDLGELLKQTEGKGINVYSHGEMLPTHGYPELKKYAHYYGHYGTAWQNQQKEFSAFPGAILMTTNCLMKPNSSYEANVFTHGLVGWPNMKHIKDYDFSALIAHAQSLPGFAEDEDKGSVTVGFARNAVMGVAPVVIDAVKAGKIRHFFLVGGCDGAKPGRNYYAEFVERLPKDTVVLTLACGKFRFFDKKLGDIGGIPRLLDIGQCNDAYSAIQIAVALAQAFNCGVNELPLSMILSWYEQKAVAILLTLLFLGVKNIKLGPSLPAFITPNVLNVLVEKFAISPISTPEADIKAILG